MRLRFLSIISLLGSLWGQPPGSALCIRNDLDFLNLRRGTASKVSEFFGPGDSFPKPDDLLEQKMIFLNSNYLRLSFRADSLARGYLTASFKLKLGRALLVMEPTLKVGRSPDYPTHLWKDFAAGDFIHGYLRIPLGHFKIIAGRYPFYEGPTFGEPFFFSGTLPPLDLVGFTFEKGPFGFLYLFSPLGLRLPDSVQRYLNYHKLAFSPADGLSLYFSEAALYGGRNALPDPYYMNPFLLYYPRLWNRRIVDENILWSFGFNAVTRNKTFYGELIIDDFPYTVERNEHPKLAWLLGTILGQPFGLDGLFLRLSYRGATRWTFGHKTSWLSFTHEGVPLGPPDGNDFDGISLDIDRRFSRSELFVAIDFRRKGEGTPWEREPSGDFPDPFFLTGVIEKRLSLSMGILLLRNQALGFRAGYSRFWDYENQKGVTKNLFNLSLSALYRI